METRHKARLIIADDHVLFAEVCKKLLQPMYDVVGIVSDGHALLELASKLKPDLVIVDISMPRLNGLDAGEQIKHLFPSVKLLYLTMNLKAAIAAEAFRRGASGYVTKQSAAEELLTALRKVLKSEVYISPLVTKETLESLSRNGKAIREEPQITVRQREVLQLLAEGMTMKEISNVLGMAPGTVAFHKYRIMRALGLNSNSELIEYALRCHMLPSDPDSARSVA